jgi:uncharacterized protein (TIRG00374 family)
LRSRWISILNVAFLVLGVGLLIGLLIRLDLEEVGRQILQVGWYFVLAFVLYVAAMLVGAVAWRQLVDPRASTARFMHILAALWAGHAINCVTPGASLGEVLKGTILKGRVQGDDLIASILVFNFLNTFVSQLYSMLGPLVCLFFLDLPEHVILALFGVACVFFIPVGVMYMLLRWGVAHRVVGLLRRIPLIKLRDPDMLMKRARSADSRIREIRRVRPRAFWISVLMIIMVRLLQGAELFVILLALLPEQSLGFVLLLALLTQTTAQLITWVATFVPGQIGVAEGGAALIYNLLHLDPLIGFSVLLVRRIRWILGIAIGLAIGFWLGLKPIKSRLPPDRPES